MDERPSSEQMRSMGFAANAEPVRLSDAGWIAFCAWVNLPPKKVPPMQRWAPKGAVDAWERVVLALAKHHEGEAK